LFKVFKKADFKRKKEKAELAVEHTVAENESKSENLDVLLLLLLLT